LQQFIFNAFTNYLAIKIHISILLLLPSSNIYCYRNGMAMIIRGNFFRCQLFINNRSLLNFAIKKQKQKTMVKAYG